MEELFRFGVIKCAKAESARRAQLDRVLSRGDLGHRRLCRDRTDWAGIIHVMSQDQKETAAAHRAESVWTLGVRDRGIDGPLRRG